MVVAWHSYTAGMAASCILKNLAVFIAMFS
jgi:hypothetical protein